MCLSQDWLNFWLIQQKNVFFLTKDDLLDQTDKKISIEKNRYC